jgi:site-specific DNA-methyltransferase (adenine-specific)
MACAVEDAGFEIRDQLQWIYGTGFPKNKNLGEGRGTALKPANEPIVLARKPITEKTVTENVALMGTGGLNIDACRIEGGIKQSTAGRRTVKWGVGEGGCSYKKGTGAEYTEEGRWPSNVILDEEAANQLDRQYGDPKGCSEVVDIGSSTTRNTYGPYTNGRSLVTHDDFGGASRFFYCAKATTEERNRGLEAREAKTVSDGRKKAIDNPYQRGKTERLNIHPTVKPLRLMEYLVKLVTPPDGIVLDPFCGSGTTLLAARNCGFKYIGIEMAQEYVDLSLERLRGTGGLLELFGE